MQEDKIGSRWWHDRFAELEASPAYDGGYWSMRSEFGERPALIVVDVVRSFTGAAGQTLAEAAAVYPTACGPSAWEAMTAIAQTVRVAQDSGWPIVYTTGLQGGGPFGGTVKGENLHGSVMDLPGATDIPDEIAPPPGAVVIGKPKASAFFDTPLVSFLVRNRVDTVIILGTTTSGCVRATVVDSFSHGYSTFVVADGCFDRSALSHTVHLAEMDVKYADVITADELAASALAHRSEMRRSHA